MEIYTALKERANKYAKMLVQVEEFRKTWRKGLKKQILSQIKAILKNTVLEAEIREQEEIRGMGSIAVRLGSKRSGIYQEEDGSDRKDFFKEFGALFYSQLFNGKIQVWMTYPFIEGLIEPKQPKLIGIYAPPEFNESLVLGHFETFLKELIEWEDYDDNDPNQVSSNKIGFGVNLDVASEKK